MPLSPGEKLGPYEILAAIGAGGMGEVYKARDTRLDRIVAIKVSKVPFDPRFQREAHAVAALNHANVCTLYDVGPDYLVMEYVEGVELKGPLPLERAIALACHILEALDAAHRKGITHRDLKPANVMVTKSGVKVLDFGLAKMEQAQGPGNSELTALTARGEIAGTLFYMAPEQLQGKEDVDSRADIFAFGCVFYEMLTGKRAFDGLNAASVIAAVMERPAPSMGEVAPAALDRVLKKCLAKEPDERWQTARDLKDELHWIANGSAQLTSPTEHQPTALSSRRSVLPWVLAAALFAIAASALAFIHFRETPLQPAAARFNVALNNTFYYALSPDGRNLAYTDNAGGAVRIWVRALDSIQPRELPGTDGATYPFWSPDGSNIGFFAQDKLKRIAAAGGLAQSLCDSPSPRGGSWNREGVIIFGNLTGGLYRVSDEGGVPQPLTRLPKTNNSETHRYPEFILGGKRFLFTSLNGDGPPEARGVFVGSTDGTPPVRILPDRSRAVYVPPSPGSRTGRLLFVRENTLMALPFDPNKLRPVGAAIPLVEDLRPSTNTFFGSFSASQNGILLYHSGNSIPARNLVWVDRTGKRIATVGERQPLRSPALSPDGRHVAYSVQPSLTEAADIWLIDVDKGTTSRFTFGSGTSQNPVWSPDGSYLVYLNSTIGGRNDLYKKQSSTGGNPELLLHGRSPNAIPYDISPDGKLLVYSETGAQTNQDLWLLPLQGEHNPQKYLDSPSNEVQAQFSPDGKWMAYVSDETRQAEVYVQSIPAAGQKYQISKTGGTQPRWRRDGKELFYVALDGRLMSVPMKLSGAALDFGAAQPILSQPGSGAGYQPSADGQKFLVAVGSEQTAAAPPFTVWLNWQVGLPK